ncbi:hypothetical protein CPB86DRAFT_786932 [Serendipita vermifera]|nr:hypothetical protein CPB86DRAFT_786932 [Serendipita vermifera]
MLDTRSTLTAPLPQGLQLSIATSLMSIQSAHNKLKCCLCGRSHSRKGRVEGCINRHLGEKPKASLRDANSQRTNSTKRFASKAKLSRHARPKPQRQTPCPFWCMMPNL